MSFVWELLSASSQPFFSIMLIDGHIEVHVSPGDGTSLRKALLHAPTGTYGDGQEHSISLVRNQRYRSTWVGVRVRRIG
jgi:laminin alpha 1/2